MVEKHLKINNLKWQKTRKTRNVLLMLVTMLFMLIAGIKTTSLAAEHTYEYIVGNIVWEYNFLSDTNSIEIASLHDKNHGDIVGSVIIPNTLPINNIEYPVTSIGTAAFKQGTITLGTNITSVTIPETVTTVGERAFYGTDLTSITIPNSVTYIGNSAFRDCKDLASVNMSNSVKTIGSYAFMDCKGLTSIALPDSIRTVDSYAFYRCSELTSATIGKSISTIGAQAFRDCSKLGSVVISNNVVSIGSYAFWNCRKITSITIPCDFDKNQFSNNTCVIVDSENPDKFTINGNSGEVLVGTFSYTHIYGDPTYTWSYDEADNEWNCLAKRTCAAKGDSTETEDATVTGNVTKKPTCVSMGETTYTAIFTNPYFSTQTKVVEDIAIDPNAHDWELAWSSNKDNHWHECALCGAKADQAAHDWVKIGIISKKIKYKCNVCGAEKTEDLLPPPDDDGKSQKLIPTDDETHNQLTEFLHTLKTPETGDYSNLSSLLIVAFSSFGGAWMLYKKGKNKK